MDFVRVSDSSRVIDGLIDMMTAALGPHDHVSSYVEVPIALLIIEVAKRADDTPEWFPRGKWATIQNIQAKCEDELGKLFPVK